MALVTTLMAGPLLKLLDPRNEYGADVEDEFAAAVVYLRRSIRSWQCPGAQSWSHRRRTLPSVSLSRCPSRWRAPSLGGS